MTDLETTKLVAVIAATWPTPGWPPERIASYCELLADLDAARSQSAVLVLRRRGAQFAPTAGEIRRSVAESYAAERGYGWLPPDEAWALVQSAFNRCGDRQPFPPLVESVVVRMGWREMGQSTNLDLLRSQFLRIYAAHLERAVTGAVATDGAIPLPPPSRPLRLVPQRLREIMGS